MSVFECRHDDIPSLMEEQVLPLIELHFFMGGVFEVGVFVCFSLALTKRSHWFNFAGFCMR